MEALKFTETGSVGGTSNARNALSLWRSKPTRMSAENRIQLNNALVVHLHLNNRLYVFTFAQFNFESA